MYCRLLERGTQAITSAVAASTSGANIAYWSLLRGKSRPPTEVGRFVRTPRTPYAYAPGTGLRRCNTYRTTLITRRTWHRCNRQRLTLSVFVVCKFRTDSVFIVQDTRETNTSLDLTQTDNGKNIETDRN